MMKKQLLFGVVITLCSTSIAARENTFPDDCMFGVATSAYQVEGGWDEEGKGETIWDHLIHHNASYATNNATGDVACDSYNKYQDDIELAFELGVKHYKLSISWSRIFPSGFGNTPNFQGISHYQDIIDRLQSRGVKTVVSLYHWDLPQPLQDIGGWTNPEMVKYFVEYARTAFKYFRTARYWVTFDEPKQICRGGYGMGTLAPNITVDGIADYLCSYVVLKAHAAVYKLYQKEFSIMQGKVGIVLDVPWSEPYTDKTEDVDAAERRNQFMVGLYANPIINGNWPEAVISRVQNRSTSENFTRSRLPEFTEDEIASIKGTYDYLGLNFYDTRYVADDEEAEYYGHPSFEYDMSVKLYTNDSWLVGTNGNTIVPWGIRKALSWIKTTYNNPTIFITDNGIADNGTLDDEERIQSITDYLNNVLDAMYDDNVTIIGYTLSLLDEFEWNLGYSAHDGLYFVDFQDDNRPRTAKQSADFYREIATSLVIPSNGTSTTPIITTTIETTQGSSPTEGSSTPEESSTTEATSETASVTTIEPSSTTPDSSDRINPFSLFILVITLTLNLILLV